MNPRLLDMVKKGSTSSRMKYNQRHNNRQSSGSMNDYRNGRSQQLSQIQLNGNPFQTTRSFNSSNQAQKLTYPARSAPMTYQTKNTQLCDVASMTANQSRADAYKLNCGYQSKSPTSVAFNMYGQQQQQQQQNYQTMMPSGVAALYSVPPPPMALIQYSYPPPVLPVKN